MNTEVQRLEEEMKAIKETAHNIYTKTCDREAHMYFYKYYDLQKEVNLLKGIKQ